MGISGVNQIPRGNIQACGKYSNKPFRPVENATVEKSRISSCKLEDEAASKYLSLR